VTAHVLLVGFAVTLLTASPAPADPAGDPLLTDAPPPVPLGIIEGSAAPTAPVSPRRSTRTTAGRSRSFKPQTQTPVEKPMDRYARIPRPQSRFSGSPTAASVGGHGGGAVCTR
jgi:hypothetical protein